MKQIENLFWLVGVLLLAVYVGTQAWSASEQQRGLAVGHMAYINERATPFKPLRTTDSINLYVTEGEHGFGHWPGVPKGQLATVVVVPDASRETIETGVAQRDPPPAVLPQTASALPWFGLGGLLSLLAGLLLTALRKHVPRSV